MQLNCACGGQIPQDVVVRKNQAKNARKRMLKVLKAARSDGRIHF